MRVLVMKEKGERENRKRGEREKGQDLCESERGVLS